MSETEALARSVVSTEFDDVPANVIEKSKENIRDYTGVAIYGWDSDIGEIIQSYLTKFGGDGCGSVFGNGTSTPVFSTFANGTFGHATDFDDGFAKYPTKPTTAIFPATLAAAELKDATGRELLTGYVVGVEAMSVILESVAPGHLDNGWVPTGTIATLGSAAAVSSVFDLSVDQTRNALGVAAATTGGIFKNLGTMTKSYHAGNSSQMGLRACMLTELGYTANKNVLSGEFGWGQVYSTEDDPYDPTPIREEFGGSWAVMNVEFKLYPSGRVTHAPMKALQDAMNDEGFGPEDVESISVSLVPHADRVLRHDQPTNEEEAKFSIEFCLAAVLREGDVGIDQFTDDYITDERTRELMAKVERVVVDEGGELYGDAEGEGGTLEITLDDGRTITTKEPHPPGSIERPLTERQQIEKFRECASLRYTDREISNILDVIAELEHEDAPTRYGRAIR